MKSQKGFSILAVILAVVVFGAVGLTGWYVYTRNNDKGKNTMQGAQLPRESEKSSGEEKSAQAAYPEGNFYIVPSWGVKIGVGDSSKVTVAEDQDSIEVSVKPEYDFYTDCTSSIDITRYKKGVDEYPEGTFGFDIKDYLYLKSGAAECGGATESGTSNALDVSYLLENFHLYGVELL